VKYKVCNKFVCICVEHKLKNGDEDRAAVLYAIVPRLFSVQDCFYVQTLRTVRDRARNNAQRTEVNKEV